MNAIFFLTLTLSLLAGTSTNVGAHEDDGEVYLYSSEDGGGELVAAYDFDDPIHVEESACAAGNCLFLAAEPGFVTDDEGQHLPAGRYFVKDGVPFRLTLVGADAGVALKFGAVVLDTPGQFINLGFSPFHAHTTYQLTLPEGETGEFSATVRFTTQSDLYADSPDYVILLTNVESGTTTSTTMATTSTTSTTFEPPLCGDGNVDAGEECDGGAADWAPGMHCRNDCTSLLCGDPDDSSTVQATDALLVLQAAIGAARCDECLCDVDSSGGSPAVTATDALRLLQASVGTQGVELVCTACS